MKLIGIVLVILAATAIGWEWARRLQFRTKQLRDIRSGLEALETEMVYGLTPLQEACSRVAGQLREPAAFLFRDFSLSLGREEKLAPDVWESTLKKMKRVLELKQGEWDVLSQFGRTLGRQDLENQRKHLRLALTYLEQQEKEARENQKKHESMYKSLGFLCGILLALIML
ncbi:stage III sporulation protein SpoIIIAB [Alteribacter natronophilus]|uniref:stage III sporulation protein SpoIIIAB n=1 Tax=Alteribacter natronophilus TaxID=2583810 RepID=UPI00110DB173|nr:stage III sporulation protein SpoIIIAB [Alteribacter natronophilus]TMW73757.1 stage III sporulation protein AB [Alteribacter natronophilus]